MRAWKICYSQKVENTEVINAVFHLADEKPDQEQAAQLVRDSVYETGFLIPDTPRGLQDVAVWQMQRMGVSITSISEIFRYHATVHNEKSEVVFECHVLGDDAGRAREILKAHLHGNEMGTFADHLIALMDVRCDIQSPLPLVK